MAELAEAKAVGTEPKVVAQEVKKEQPVFHDDMAAAVKEEPKPVEKPAEKPVEKPLEKPIEIKEPSKLTS